MNGLLSSWAVELALVTWRSFRGGNQGTHAARPPLPSEVAAVMLVFGTLGLAPGQAQGVAGAIGWGLVVATFLNLNWQAVGQLPGQNVNTQSAGQFGQKGRGRIVPAPSGG